MVSLLPQSAPSAASCHLPVSSGHQEPGRWHSWHRTDQMAAELRLTPAIGLLSPPVMTAEPDVVGPGALRGPLCSWPKQPQPCAGYAALEEAGQGEVPGHWDLLHVHREESLACQEPDSPSTEETWDSSADESPMGDFPRQDPSLRAGIGVLCTAEEQPPEEGPGNLEPLRPSPGRSGARGLLTPGLGEVHEKQGEDTAMTKLLEPVEDVAVYFTWREWELLEAGDKELYRDQMLRNYQALVSLGYRGPTPDLICHIQQGETELWVDDNEEGGESWLSEDVSPVQSPLASLHNIALLQDQAPDPEKHTWRLTGCLLHPDHLWRSLDSCLVAPLVLLPHLARIHHGMAHVNKGGMIEAVKLDWFAPTFPSVAQQYCRTCPICQAHNMGKPVKTKKAAHLPPWGPFVNLQLDFIQMQKCCSYEYLRVIVCMFSGWVEAYPCAKADTITVSKKLLRDFIPRFGFPLSLNSDRGTRFPGQVMKEVCKVPQIQQNLHCPYHPQASGRVECQNGILKNKLAKICAETHLKWPDALPVALISMRSTASRKTGLSPHEILMGRPMRLPASPPVASHFCYIHSLDDTILDYCKALMRCVKAFHSQVQAALPREPGEPCQSFRPGD